jgi:hypothetical protein
MTDSAFRPDPDLLVEVAQQTDCPAEAPCDVCVDIARGLAEGFSITTVTDLRAAAEFSLVVLSPTAHEAESSGVRSSS